MRSLSARAFAVASALFLGAALAQEGAGDSARPAALAEVTGVIGPATTHHVESAIGAAREMDAEVLILEIDTPGGLVTSMREIITAILASPVPVVGYVAPPGGRAASAGTYIVYATHIAAMAPGTNIGAATPIQLGGFPGLDGEGDEDGESEPGGEGGPDAGTDREADEPRSREPGNAAERKAVNDAVAFIRSLAELRGRNAAWAEKAVRQGASISADRALALGVVELMARDVGELLAAIDGRTVEAGGTERRLATRGIAVERIEPSFVTRVLGLLGNPNIAFLLMLIGAYGLIFELANPGTGPGIAGAILLVLGLYALNQLPLNYAGLALVLLGIALMAAEAFTPTFGALGIGGLAAFVIGSAMLVDTDVPAYQLSWTVIGTTAALSGAILTLLLGYLWRTHRRPVRSGIRVDLGSEAEVLDWSDGEGHVWAHGARWNARGPSALAAGERVRIADIDGLTLDVRRMAPAPPQGSGASDGENR